MNSKYKVVITDHRFPNIDVQRKVLSEIEAELVVGQAKTEQELIELTKEKAKDHGYRIISIIAFADNSPALALYKVHGFQSVKKINLEGNKFIPHHEGCLLLKCDIAT